jgi:beta-N-acetylhexosaminidase
VNTPNNLIISPSTLRLTQQEKQLFAQLNPWGIILFARNIESPEQVHALLNDIKNTLQRESLVVLIDQEGGRVSRLPKTHWRIPPSPQVFASLFMQSPQRAKRACYINNALIGHELKSLGINVNCAPMLDIPQKDAADIIHERAYGATVQQVIALGEQVIEGLHAASVEPVIKHMPGHGRGRCDSHFELPTVEADIDTLSQIDFAPFRAFNKCSMAMSAHIVYEQIDAQLPASISSTVINDIIRENIGFDGLIMTDDINMQALSGTVAQRATAAIHAGADVVLHCSGKLDEMQMLQDVATPLKGKSLQRASSAQQRACAAMPDIDVNALYHELNQLLSTHA